MTKAIPEGYQSITPMFMFRDSRKAIEFYKKAFGAVERYVMPGPDGKGVMHAEIMIGNSILMLGDEGPNDSCKSAETVGCSPVNFYVYVEDVDEAFKKAVAAGAEIKMPVQDMFWGDRFGSLNDPFGYNWGLATHTRDLSDDEIRKGAEAMFENMGKGV